MMNRYVNALTTDRLTLAVRGIKHSFSIIGFYNINETL